MRITGKRNKAVFKAAFQGVFLVACFVFYGCGPDVPTRPAPKPAVKPSAKSVQEKNDALKAMQALQEPVQGGYIYDQRHRRDPFVPLIVPKTNSKETKIASTGTLESYDIGEFTLAAIIEKGEQNFALVVAPDNRSFTLNEGTVIGLNKGKVEEISGKMVVLVEYSKDYKGKLRPRKIIMDLRKGE